MRLILGLVHTNDDAVTEAREELPTITYDIDDGTSADQIDLLWHDQRTLGVSASENLDVAGGLTDSYGNTLTMVDVRLIVVKASENNTNNVLVGGGSNALVNWVSDSSDVVVVKPGGVFFLYTPTNPGYAVTAGTGDILKIANSAGTTGVTYDIFIGGVSA